MKVTVFGIGYVGLVQAAVLSEVGHDVCCVDVDEKKIADLKEGVIPIYEPGLSPLVMSNFEAGRISFTTSAEEGIEFGDIIFIAVGTPPDEDGSADLRYVLSVAETIASHMNRDKIIVNKSTVPVGTADKVLARVNGVLEERFQDQPRPAANVISNPEFLKEGVAVSDCMRPDRIVIGIDAEGETKQQLMTEMRELYAPFNRNHDRILFMDVKSAELTKYAANCMLATKISFMNEVANIAERVGADIENVRKGIGSDQRIGYQFIYPGCGYGGSCFPKDIQALIRASDQMGCDSKILKAVEDVNNRQKHKLFEYVCAHYECDPAQARPTLEGKTFALWGLSFKPKTDDMREAPSRVVMEALWAAGAKVQAFDPEAMDEAQRIYGSRDDLVLMGTKEMALKGADALIICTEWQNFKAPDFGFIQSELRDPVIFDGRNLFEPENMKTKGFKYWSVGRI
ncbi:MAG: UDP-glucose dehydrogenase family protein [Cellvibrionaceae bacterium]